MAKILIIDDDTSFGLMIEGFLKRKGFDTVFVSSFNNALHSVRKTKFDLVLTDYRLDSGTGLDLIPVIKKHHQKTPVVLITAYSDIRVAVSAIKLGAFEYITKPVNPDELLHVINRGIEKTNKVSDTPKPPVARSNYIKGISRFAEQVDQQVELIATTDLSVLVLGESGVGKEFVAQRIHELSNRSAMPFVAVDCGALHTDIAGSELFGHRKGSFTGAMDDKEGHFEAVKDGTIFLDEIGNLSYDVQVKLLRAIQERKGRRMGSNEEYAINCRIIAATNEDLRSSSLSGKFREDLYHRLNEFSINILPLRERKEDIPLYSKRFLQLATREFKKEHIFLSSEVEDIFFSYEWPGNLRELRNVIRRAVLLAKGDTITLAELPPEIQMPSKIPQAPVQLRDVKEKSEKDTIIEILEQNKYNKAKTARILGIDRKTLYNKIYKYGIDA
ncbi:two-component system, NtrC family, response regulator HydG [Saccharicrinis carchari]|uniref:Two-component system, NtrC family, response regulator HydG n=1 Tax=Saccharicrinis carchari TaxID=1168039 RepID=A0A521CHV2_SACCC|nr:sigma-54 dependent transcriptional regulator [Saccharicrinis carchari]SMO58935.1 two-component system, NtrC family, response regulator HydG [Saccharicrinis carchari]